MSESERTYLPAAGNHWSLPLYDPIVRLIGADAARRTLLEQAALRPGHRVLDIGCGTGTLAVLIKGLHPEVEVVGIDPDPKAIERGRRKAERASVDVRFDRGFADEMPYPDGSFDRVVSSLMFHHLPAEVKAGALGEVRRVLAGGGSLHLLDFAGPEAGHGFFARLMHTSNHLKENSEGTILELMGRAGLGEPRKVGAGTMIFGQAHVNYYRATAK